MSVADQAAPQLLGQSQISFRKRAESQASEQLLSQWEDSARVRKGNNKILTSSSKKDSQPKRSTRGSSPTRSGASPRSASCSRIPAVEREALRLMLQEMFQAQTTVMLDALQRQTHALQRQAPPTIGGPHELASEKQPGLPRKEDECPYAEDWNGVALASCEVNDDPLQRDSDEDTFGSEASGPRADELPSASFDSRHSGYKKGSLITYCRKVVEGSSHPWMRKVEGTLEDWDRLKNPVRNRWIDIVVSSATFQLATMTLIILNSVYVAHDANLQMQAYAVDRPPVSPPQQHIFLVLYAIELSMRLASEGCYFFYGDHMRWNWFDTLVFALSILSISWDNNSQGFLRVMRLTRIVKVTRFFKVLYRMGINDLQQMVHQVFGSLRSLFWCIVLFAFITYIFALFFMFSLADLPKVEDEADIGLLRAYFGSVNQTMLTLLMATTGGIDWHDVYVILEAAGSTVSLCFVFYVLFFVIAVWNIITATFVDKVMQMAKPTYDTIALEQRSKEVEAAEDLRDLLKRMDIDDSNSMSVDELKDCLENQDFQNFLVAHGVHIHEASTFFEMLFESGHIRELHIESLVAYCLRIKGQATSLDLQCMRYELTAMLKANSKRIKDIEREMARIDGHICAAVRRRRSIGNSSMASVNVRHRSSHLGN